MISNVASSLPNSVTRTLICVDSRLPSDFCGTLYNPYLQKPAPFGQAKDIITILEDFFNRISYPQPYFDDRSFLEDKLGPEAKKPAPVRRYLEEDVFSLYKGRVATFELEVRHRKNASWQGRFLWVEGGLHHTFRSTLEVLMLMDRAVFSSERAGGP